jgi:hypothetical protein
MKIIRGDQFYLFYRTKSRDLLQLLNDTRVPTQFLLVTLGTKVTYFTLSICLGFVTSTMVSVMSD